MESEPTSMVLNNEKKIEAISITISYLLQQGQPSELLRSYCLNQGFSSVETERIMTHAKSLSSTSTLSPEDKIR